MHLIVFEHTFLFQHTKEHPFISANNVWNTVILILHNLIYILFWHEWVIIHYFLVGDNTRITCTTDVTHWGGMTLGWEGTFSSLTNT